MRTALILIALALAGCGPSDQERARQQAERTREDARRTAEQVRQKAGEAARQAGADAAKASREIDHALNTTRDSVRRALDDNQPPPRERQRDKSDTRSR